MNERIKDLAEQAWKEILDETNIDGDISTVFSADEVVAFEQKFAELIVKECTSLCEIEGDSYKYSATQVRASWSKAVSNQCSKRIREHFGVEE